MECPNGGGGGEDQSKVSELKEELLQLSGLACQEGEENAQIELLEKLNKISRDMLVLLCRSFGLPGSRANRKEDLLKKLRDLLKVPCFDSEGTNPDKVYVLNCKINDLKDQILQLARFTYHEEEEKSQAELLEKLSKCNKGTLVELCRSFDIPGSTANKKTELVTIVMEFLHEHCSGTDGTNPDKKTKKRRRKIEGPNLSGGKPLKKKKLDGTALETPGEMEAEGSKCEEAITNYSVCNLKDIRNEYANNKKGKFPKEEVNPEPSERINGYVPENFDGVAVTELQILTNGQELAMTPFAKVIGHVEGGDRTDMKASKKKNTSITKKKTTPMTDRKEKSCGKQMARGNMKPQKHAAKPSRDELRQAVFFILDTADFAMMTFGEVVKEVDKYFGKDLFERKPLIRSLIEEELFRLAEEAENKELEAEEIAEAKARADKTKDGRVGSDIEKADELQVVQHIISEDDANNEIDNSVEKGVKGGIYVEADDNRNSGAAAECSQDDKAEDDTHNENIGGEFTNNVKSEKFVQNSDSGARVEGETAEKNSGDTIKCSKDDKTKGASTEENGDTTEYGRNENARESAKCSTYCGTEEAHSNENGEHVDCVQDGKAQEASNVENGDKTAFHDAKNVEGKEAMGNASTDQSLTDAGDHQHNANTEVDVDSTEDGETNHEGKTNSDDIA